MIKKIASSTGHMITRLKEKGKKNLKGYGDVAKAVGKNIMEGSHYANISDKLKYKNDVAKYYATRGGLGRAADSEEAYNMIKKDPAKGVKKAKEFWQEKTK